MEVTKENFAQALPLFREAVSNATFIAIDTEFTGLNRRAGACTLDTPEDRYQILRKGSAKFSITQYGICPFCWDEASKKYIARPFNFYVFKRPFNRQEENVTFECQNSALEFLGKQGFDFNKWVKGGLSYMYPSDEDHHRSTRFKYTSNGTPSEPTTPQKVQKKPIPTTPIPASQKKYVEDVCDKANNLLKSPDEKFLILSPSSSFNRRLIYEAVERRFPDCIQAETCRNEKNVKVMKLSCVTAEEKKAMQKAKNAEDLDQFEMAVGFSKIIDILSKSKKIIVGHNMLLDVLLTINQFITPLPQSFSEFKQVVQTVFPRIMDTKLLASMPPIKEYVLATNLADVKTRIEDEPFQRGLVALAQGFTVYNNGQDRLHEAAYDAYITGYSFAGLSLFLCNVTKQTTQIDLDNSFLNSYLNRIFIMRIQDLNYVTMDSKDNVPERRHVFHLEFPSRWRTEDISDVFSPYGYVYVTWISDTSAYASLAKDENSQKVYDELVCQPPRGPYQIQTYADYHELHDDDDNHLHVKTNESHDNTTRKRLLSNDDDINDDVTPVVKAKKIINEDDIEEGELATDEESEDHSFSKNPESTCCCKLF